MRNNIKLTILTPIYNRVNLLPRIFASLQSQTVKNFEWLVIDDGSTDNIQEYMQFLPEADFPIHYHYKKNGGKHTALNYSHPYIKGESVLILDSDDYLIKEAVEIILNDWQKYINMSRIGVLSYERGGQSGETISVRGAVTDYYVSDDIHYRVNRGIAGDRAEVIRADIFKKLSFPEFPNEKFMSEGWLFNNIARNYQTVYIKKIIYICEYLAGGLTKSGRRLRMQSPHNMMEACKSFFVDEVCLKTQVKEMLLYCIYGLCSELSMEEWIRKSGRPWKIILVMPLGYLIFRWWKWKYRLD